MKKISSKILLLWSLVGIIGCQVQPPAPYEIHSSGNISIKPPKPQETLRSKGAMAERALQKALNPQPVDLKESKKITVKPGQTLYSISREHHLPLRRLIEVNHLKPPFYLKTGDVIILPKTKVHLVQGGDTLYSLARAYKVELNQLVKANELKEPYKISTGTPLIIPTSFPLREPGFTKATPPKALLQKKEEKGLLSNQEGLLQAPTLKPSFARKEPLLLQKEINEKAKPKAMEARELKRSLQAKAPLLEKNLRLKFIKPVQGKLVAKYGMQAGGLYNDGINFSAPRGTPVVAAEEGIVVYKGNEIRGFGELILIRHLNGWITAYAHNESTLVAKGDKVKKGQPIAKVGKTGAVLEPQLHFEIRNGTQTVDPLLYLAS